MILASYRTGLDELVCVRYVRKSNEKMGVAGGQETPKRAVSRNNHIEEDVIRSAGPNLGPALDQ
jgi:hypothetical protein